MSAIRFGSSSPLFTEIDQAARRLGDSRLDAGPV